jgi:hypothetical protein
VLPVFLLLIYLTRGLLNYIGKVMAAELLAPTIDINKPPRREIDLAVESPVVLPRVASVLRANPGELGIDSELAPRTVYRVGIDDPYEAAWEKAAPELIADIKGYERDVDRHVHNRRMSGRWQREPQADAYGDARLWGDQETLREVLADIGSVALEKWQRSIPSPFALLPVYSPLPGSPLFNRRGRQVGELDEITSAILTVLKEPHGVRSRGAVMAHALRQYVDRGSLGGEELKVASVASGTTLPVLLEAKETGVPTAITPIDIDNTATSFVLPLAEQVGFPGRINPPINDVDAFKPEDVHQLAMELAANGQRPHVAEFGGAWEYIKDHASEVLAAWYDLIQPGGLLIGSQIRSDRGIMGGNPHDPSTEFTMGAVCWPYIETRTPKEVMRVIKEAGINPDQVTLYLPEDGVNTIFAIDKPKYSHLGSIARRTINFASRGLK